MKNFVTPSGSAIDSRSAEAFWGLPTMLTVPPSTTFTVATALVDGGTVSPTKTPEIPPNAATLMVRVLVNVSVRVQLLVKADVIVVATLARPSESVVEPEQS